MANGACLMLQWALDAYDFHFVGFPLFPKQYSQSRQLTLRSLADPARVIFAAVSSLFLFLKGTRHVLTMTAAREFSLSLLLLIESRKNDAGGTILQRGVEIATKTLQVCYPLAIFVPRALFRQFGEPTPM